MSSGSPDWLQPVVGVNVTVEEGEPDIINVEDSPVAETWGWDKDAEIWRKILVNSDGKLIIDPSEIFEDDPTDNEHGKAPTSNWAHDHEENANIHHTKTTLHGEITDFHDAVQDTLSCRGSLVEKAAQLSTDTVIYEMVVFDSKLYGIAYPDGALYEWNGTDAWVSKAPKYGGIPGGYSLCVFNGKIYTGQINSGDLLEWNGTNAWVKKASGLNGGVTIFTLVSYNSKLYAGVQGDGELWEWNDVDTWTSVASKYGSEDDIRKLIVFNGKLYGGGNPAGLLLEWNDSNAWVLKSQPAGIQADIESMCEHNGKLYVGSDVSARLWEWDGVSIMLLKAPQYLGQTFIDSLISFNGILYGGSYVSAYLLAWNGVDAWLLASRYSGTEKSIRSLCEFNGKVYGGTADHAKLLLFDQPTLCEFQMDSGVHHAKTYKASEITEGVFDRDRLATASQMPIFINRGNIAANDWVCANFTFNNTDRTWDLSSVVPAGALMVMMKLSFQSSKAGDYCWLWHPDYTRGYNCQFMKTNLANNSMEYCVIVQCNAAREIKYRGNSSDINLFNVVVRGWWI